MDQVVGPLSFTWETWIECLASGNLSNEPIYSSSTPDSGIQQFIGITFAFLEDISKFKCFKLAHVSLYSYFSCNLPNISFGSFILPTAYAKKLEIIHILTIKKSH